MDMGSGSRLRRAFPGGAVAASVLAAATLIGLASWSVRPSHQELVALPVASSLVKETYSEDASVGEKIMQKMAGRVHNPIWTQLMGNRKMRTALAAAIGAERLAPGGSSASAFNLGNLLSGMTDQKRSQVKQQLRLAGVSHAPQRFERAPRAEPEPPLSPWREWERSQARSRAHSRELLRRVHSRAGKSAPSWVPEMPDRLAANGWQQALSIRKKKVQQVPRAHHSVHQDAHRILHTNFVFDEFAPGVLPDTSPPAPPPLAAAVKKAPVAAPVKKASKPAQSVKEGVEKATGFGDTIVNVGESAEDKLKQEVLHLKAMNTHEKQQFEKREKVDIEHNLMTLEKKQLDAPTSSSAAAAAAHRSAAKASMTSIGPSSSAADQKAQSVLKGAKGDGKKVLGMLKDAEEQRKAEEIAWGEKKGHLSKAFRSTQKEKLHFEDEEKKEAVELEDEVAMHAAIISGESVAHEPHAQSMTANAKRWSDGFVNRKGYVEGGWRALAERSKKLAHKAAGGASAATSSPHVIPAAATRATHAAAKAAPAHSGSGAGKRGAGGGRARRPRSRRSRSHGESWETEIRKDSLPIVCGLPLLAEASGINCNSVKRVHKLKGHNRILKDLKSVGLGDNEIGTGNRKHSATGPFKKGGALGLPHQKWGTQLAPSRSFGAGSAIQALGYTSAAQYEKHTLLSTIAKEEDTIERLRMKMAAKKGGIKSSNSRTPAPAVTAAGYRRERALASGGQQALLQRQQLETEVAREQREMGSFRQQGIGARTLGAQSLASALVSDVQGTSGAGSMTGTESYNAHNDVRYMGDKMVQTNGNGGIALELAGTVPDGLSIDSN